MNSTVGMKSILDLGKVKENLTVLLMTIDAFFVIMPWTVEIPNLEKVVLWGYEGLRH